LAFALKLLYLAPAVVQARVSRQLRRFLAEQWGATQTERVARVACALADDGKRWYDQDPDTAFLMELLRSSPAFLKSRVADTLLEILCADAPEPLEAVS
jgi:hypothetical protein